MLKEKIHKDIVEILHGMCVNPQTGYPLSTNMIENMLKEVGYSINIDDSAKRQALKVFDILSKNYDNLIQRAFMRIQIICDEFLKNDLIHFLNTHSVIFEENKTSQHLKREDSGTSKDGESHGGVGVLQNKKGGEEKEEKESECENESENESDNENENEKRNGKYVGKELTRKKDKEKEKIKGNDYDDDDDDDDEEEEKDYDEHEETDKTKEKENNISQDTDTVTEIVNDMSHINEVDEVDKTNEDTDSKREFHENEKEGENNLVMEEEKENNISAKLQKEKNHCSVKTEEDLSTNSFDEEDLKNKNKKNKNKKKEVEKKETKHSEKHKIVFLCYPYLYKYIDEYVQKNKKYYSCKILNSNVKIATIRKVKTDVEHVPSKNFGHELDEKKKEGEIESDTKKGKKKGKGKGKSKLRGRNDSEDERERKKKELEEAQIAAREEQLKKLAEAEIRIKAANGQTDTSDNMTLNTNNGNVTCVMMCSSCVMKIPKSEYKMHCRSDFHVFNAKRKYKNLPPVTLEEYKEIDFDTIHFRVDT